MTVRDSYPKTWDQKQAANNQTRESLLPEQVGAALTEISAEVIILTHATSADTEEALYGIGTKLLAIHEHINNMLCMLNNQPNPYESAVITPVLNDEILSHINRLYGYIASSEASDRASRLLLNQSLQRLYKQTNPKVS